MTGPAQMGGDQAGLRIRDLENHVLVLFTVEFPSEYFMSELNPKVRYIHKKALNPSVTFSPFSSYPAIFSRAELLSKGTFIL